MGFRLGGTMQLPPGLIRQIRHELEAAQARLDYFHELGVVIDIQYGDTHEEYLTASLCEVETHLIDMLRKVLETSERS